MKGEKMLSLLFMFLAGVLNAFMDTIEEGHFGKSIFKNLDPKFWYKWQSWKYAKKIGGYPLDAWHIAKSLWWSSMVGGIITYYFTGPIFPHWILDFATLGLVPMLTFNLFYNHIFKKP